ncbi:hypothetical protein HZY93_08810 [Streptococcus danieliae]|uniref:Transposase Synechocystis PCC 6803 domain-containing protein n=1 Tax=Streptococcus danieliae TaxID=747656 RepID=A0A7Z0LEE8_9STRE|nr:hypothetical protein [Streptococcus danieliae]NYS49977.1 hypothetical protein [Streptococcus danieliae]
MNRKQRISKAKKIPLDKLEKFVKKHPDAFLKEIAEEFSGVSRILCKLQSRV